MLGPFTSDTKNINLFPFLQQKKKKKQRKKNGHTPKTIEQNRTIPTTKNMNEQNKTILTLKT